MKESAPSGKDEALSKLLGAWELDAQLPPRFQDAVWQRIKRAEGDARTALWRRVLGRIEAAFARPALAAAYVAVLLFAGVGAGYWRAEGRIAQVKLNLRTRYVQTVDPYQMPHRL
jgi:hypothetical protein